MTRKFEIGDRVRKIGGSSWHGHVCGFYSTDLTPYGYCVESEREIGSVQIYPERALEAVSTKEHSLGQQLAEARAALKNIASVDVREAGAAHRLEQMQMIARDALQSHAPAEGLIYAQVDETDGHKYCDKLVSQLAEARAGALEEGARICDSYDAEMTARAAEEIRELASLAHKNIS